MLPNDPNILFSLVNTYLRDRYPSAKALCEDQNLPAQTLFAKMKAAGFVYDRAGNRFVAEGKKP